MAGHSKWSNIKHRKKRNDDKKNKLYSKLIRDITTSIKNGDKNIETNSNLKKAINNALFNNLSKDIINRNISDFCSNNKNYVVSMYAGYWLYGIAFLINCNVLNKNKVASELRYTLIKNNGKLVNVNSVSHLFKKVNKIIIIPKLSNNFINNYIKKIEKIEYNETDDIIYLDDSIKLDLIKKVLIDSKYEIKCSVTMLPLNIIKLKPELLTNIINLVKSLNSLEYVESIFINIIL